MAGGRPSALRPAAFFKTLKARVPELFELADIELELFSNLDSSEMQPELWSRMAAHLHRRLPDFDGAVVTHGTDTLAYTASALSFMLRGLPSPVVLTGLAAARWGRSARTRGSTSSTRCSPRSTARAR